MSTRVYIASPDCEADLNAAARAIVRALASQGGEVTVFKPLTDAANTEELVGASFSAFKADRAETETQIIAAFETVLVDGGAAVAIGTDYTGVTAPVELGINGDLAADLALPVVLAVDAGRGAERAAGVAAAAIEGLDAHHAVVVGLLATGAEDAEAARTALAGLGLPVAVLGDDLTPLLAAAESTAVPVRTPARFSHELMARAQSNLQTIVLPESEDPRILEAASVVAARGVAHVVLLGEKDKVLADAEARGFDLTGVEIVSMNDPERLESYAAKFAELRAKKGVTIEQAREAMADGAYFGTMMVYLGEADGLVSGANHTTANTIRPALQFIKTQPGMRTVSGALLMSLADRVYVFADCAVTPNPTPEQLADIAISSAGTAEMFGVAPRVAMLSYSTGTSGKGPDVDLVREGYELATTRAPELKLAGPIQFDAAIDPVVGAKKMPGSPVAGQATVFVFPDLNTGNNTYKAVQRTAGAIAIGPLLQGLRRPVNDLSRGALVEDIVNTIVMTAIQAQATDGALG
ncbi:phosphate acetyltransferase [Propionibacterium sp.]|uniref:phosphate acetyltransferase n=1 Tax=Propionibacterium sp. TaxID=1977903 RepID=UPI0039ED993C